jgi:hypothetical protein
MKTRCLGVLLAMAVACGGSDHATTLSSSWTPPSSLAFVPADTPYLAVSLSGANAALDELAFHQLGSSAALWVASQPEAPDKPVRRMLWQFAREIAGKSYVAAWTSLGLRPHGHFLVYGLGLWPVVRLELADPAAARAMLARVMAGAGTATTFGGAAGWQVVEDRVAVGVAIVGDELVLTAATAAMLPAVAQRAFTERAAQPMTSAAILDIANRHHLSSAYLLEIDTRATIAQIAALVRATGEVKEIAVANDCTADAERLAALVPRYVIGYQRADAHAIDGSFAIELAPELARGLDNIHVALPKLAPSVDHPLLTMQVGVDVDAAVAWLRGAAGMIAAQPFACHELHGVNEAAAELRDKLADVIPADWRGLRGMQAVVDDATMKPPTGIGYGVLYGSRLVAALAKVGPIPGMSTLPIPGGPPVELPTATLGMPGLRAFFGIALDRAVMAVGEDGQARAQGRLTAGATERVPLISGTLDLDAAARKLPELAASMRAQLPGVMREGMALDVRDGSIVLDFHAEMAP